MNNIIYINDIVQIAPEHEWGGALVIVTKIKPWGIQGYVEIPLHGQAYVRLKNNEFEKVGVAVYVAE